MGSKQSLLFILISFMLAGCVSNSDPMTDHRDKDKAVESYMSLAKGYIQGGYTEKAVKPLNRALEIDSRSSDVHGMLGLVYQLQGENVLAEKAFRRALSYNSDAADIQNNYGAFLFSQGRLDEAYTQFSRAAENVDYEKRSRAFENMGIVAARQGSHTMAREHFEKSLRLNGNLPRARIELASSLKQLGDYRTAWAHYLTYTRQARQNARSLWLGVQLARYNGDRSAAASYALQLERLYPGSKELKAYRSLVRHEYR